MFVQIKTSSYTTYLVCVCSNRYSEGSCKAEVSELDLPQSIDEEVLWLQVSMQDPVRVAEGQALQQLEQITLTNARNTNPGESPQSHPPDFILFLLS